MLCENPKLAEQLFEHYAIPMRVAREKVMLLIPFFDCLAHLEALEGSSPVLHLALEMTGVPSHKQRGAATALLTREHASSIFKSEASLFSAEPDGFGSGLTSAHVAHSKDGTGKTSFLGLTAANFMGCLSRVSEVLEEKRNELQDSMRHKVLGKNRRLPLRDIRELRGQSRKDQRPVSPNSPVRQNPQDPETLHSPMASISAMRREVADPPARQAALFKALKSHTVKSEYKQLARQVVREAMLQLDAAVKDKTRTRRELDWLLVLRDQALTSLGLIVSEVQEIATKDDLADAGAHISKGPETHDDHQVMATWGPPAWAWVVPSDLKKPISPVMDGWYLVSGDPGPKLRLMGPLKNRSMAIKGIQEFKTMDMKLFNTCLIRESTVVEKFVYDASCSKIEGDFSGATKPDGWYVMINESEKLLWTLGLEIQQIERELAMSKKDAILVRKTLRDLQVPPVIFFRVLLTCPSQCSTKLYVLRSRH
jgi:hypothetical protein